jgi:hypothetical protein
VADLGQRSTDRSDGLLRLAASLRASATGPQSLKEADIHQLCEYQELCSVGFTLKNEGF